MSGHSHWAGIKHKKKLMDERRGKIFSKISRLITIAAKTDPDPDTNPKLKLAIDKARSVNMPKENIERAIKKATGEIEGAKIEEVTYEAYGPKGVALIIETITDNKNRSLAEIKNILSKFNGKIGQPGSVKYLFERKGSITIKKNKDPDELSLIAIDCGAEDIRNSNSSLEIITKPEQLEEVKKKLEEKNINIERVSLDWVPKQEVKVDEKTEEQLKKLFEALDENDDVQEIYSNLANIANH